MAGTPARGYSWAAFDRGNAAALKHGGHSAGYLAPAVERMVAELAEVAPWSTRPAFGAEVAAWATAESVCVWFRERFDRLGIIDEETGEVRRGVAEWERWERRAAKLREALGLNPMALARLLSILAGSPEAGAVVAEEREALLAEARTLVEGRPRD